MESASPADHPYLLRRRPLSAPCSAESLRAEAALTTGGDLEALRDFFWSQQTRWPANHRLQSHLYACLPMLEHLIRSSA